MAGSMRKTWSGVPKRAGLVRRFDPAERDRVIRDFRAVVNMTRRQLSAWLDTDESHEVGYRYSPHEESVGHRSGRRVIEILGKKQAELSDLDIAHARKVIGYVRRHLAQRPHKDITHTRWAYSLKNWGHDPTKNT
jgi:Protein of unknown function (DUF3140)